MPLIDPPQGLIRQAHRMRPEDRAVLCALRGLHRGKRAFILGCGPSIALEDPHRFKTLRREVTIACNFLMRWKGLTFQPSYWTASEMPHIEQISSELDAWEGGKGHAATDGSRRLFSSHFPDFGVTAFKKWTWIWRSPNIAVQHGYMGGFTAEPEGHPSYFAHTGSVVMDVGMQLAIWMGCNPIYFLGVDSEVGGHVYDTVKSYEPFVPNANFLKGGMKAEALLAEQGIKLRNLAVGGSLEVTRESLTDVLAHPGRKQRKKRKVAGARRRRQ